jgi:hypothetical protein
MKQHAYWVERKVGKRWQREEAYALKIHAEKAAGFYRRLFHKPARVQPCEACAS